MAGDLEQIMHLAAGVALEAGKALKVRDSRWQQVTGGDGKDVKVSADKRAEDLIVAQLSHATPHTILSEETGWIQRNSASGVWVVDPLDGSSNYSRDFPACAVSIAFVREGRPVMGVIYDFYRDELFSGFTDGDSAGAWLNHVPMRVSVESEKGKATLMTGLPVRRDFSPEAMRAFGEEMAAWRKVRMIGSAALALAYVAAGRADQYHEENSMMWDVAAGCALVEAAGGTVTLSEGPLDEPKTVLASNGLLSA